MARSHWHDVEYWKDMSEKTWSTLNGAMGEVAVTPGLNMLMTIDSRSYHMLSSSSGRLSINTVSDEEVNKLLPSVQARVNLNHDAFREEMQQYPKNFMNIENMLEKRKIEIEGDLSVFFNVQSQLDSRLDDVQAQMAAIGAHSSDVKDATLYHLDRLEAHKAEREKAKVHNCLDFYDLSSWAFSTGSEMPVLQSISSLLLFSAGATMFGNVGQSNYSAANCVLDAVAFSMRQSGSPAFTPSALMWGAVGGLGMRWKAFGSSDALLAMENSADIMLDFKEAGTILRVLVQHGHAPEWVLASKTDAAGYEMIAGVNKRAGVDGNGPDPWGFAGRGGGAIHVASAWEGVEKADEMPEPTRKSLRASSRERQGQPMQRLRPQNATKTAWLFEGRRVQICSLERSTHMNGVKGTLIAEVEPGKWQLKLDGDYEDKLVRIENLMTLTGKPLTDFSGSADSGVQEPMRPMEQYCIAGSWDDWLPHDMQWDLSQLCFVFEIDVHANAQTLFAICRGKAGDKKWKTRGQNTWSIKRESHRSYFQIRLFLSAGGSVKKVDWAKMPRVAS